MQNKGVANLNTDTDVPNSANSAGGGVILKPPVKQGNPRKNWCFTLNNYTENEFSAMCHDLEELGEFIIGKEIGKEGTPHLQGFVSCKVKKRFEQLKKINNRLHLEKSRGTKKQNYEYCSKEGNFISNIEFEPETHVYAKMTYDMLRNNQKEIVDLFDNDEDPLFGRKVHWFFELEGNWGKSIVCKYLVDNREALIVQGKNNDILYAVQQYIQIQKKSPKIVVFDCPRCNQGHVSFQAIESIKNGCLFSGKYEGGMLRFDSPHVIVFSNEHPAGDELSLDRWEIRELQ